jgi:hypothetical protein
LPAPPVNGRPGSIRGILGNSSRLAKSLGFLPDCRLP